MILDEIKSCFNEIIEKFGKDLDVDVEEVINESNFPDNLAKIFVAKKDIVNNDEDLRLKTAEMFEKLCEYYDDEKEKDTVSAVIQFVNKDGELENSENFEYSKEKVSVGKKHVYEVVFLVDGDRKVVCEGDKMVEKIEK